MTHGTGTVGRAALALGLIMSLGLSACGGDDDDDGTSAGSGGSAGSTTAGTGGSAGSTTAGSGGSRPPMMRPMQMPVMCNGTPCMPPGMSLLMPCCLSDQSCGGGLMGECHPWNAPGTADATCPSHMTMTGSTLTGCCKPDNQCGVMSTQGLGCVERTQLAMYAGGPLDAIQCGTMMPGENDAGSD